MLFSIYSSIKSPYYILFFKFLKIYLFFQLKNYKFVFPQNTGFSASILTAIVNVNRTFVLKGSIDKSMSQQHVLDIYGKS